MYRFFYWPFLYTNKAKLFKSGRLISYLGIFTIPPIYFALILQAPTITLQNLFSCLLGIILIQNLYEVGYIQNDTETIKKEKNPTMRLEQADLDYYSSNRFGIYVTRAIIDVILVGLLVYVNHGSMSVWVFLGVAHTITPIFLLYNAMRNKWNILLHFFLATLKFSSLQFLFFDSLQVNVFILSIFGYPIINLIDRAATPRFLKRFSVYYIPRTAILRAVYYWFLLVFCLVGWYFDVVKPEALVIVVYFVVYRSLIVLTRMK